MKYEKLPPESDDKLISSALNDNCGVYRERSAICVWLATAYHHYCGNSNEHADSEAILVMCHCYSFMICDSRLCSFKFLFDAVNISHVCLCIYLCILLTFT